MRKYSIYIPEYASSRWELVKIVPTSEPAPEGDYVKVREITDMELSEMSMCHRKITPNLNDIEIAEQRLAQEYYDEFTSGYPKFRDAAKELIRKAKARDNETYDVLLEFHPGKERRHGSVGSHIRLVPSDVSVPGATDPNAPTIYRKIGETTGRQIREMCDGGKAQYYYEYMKRLFWDGWICQVQAAEQVLTATYITRKNGVHKLTELGEATVEEWGQTWMA